MRLFRTRREPPAPHAIDDTRVLILSADVGEGHVAAARALAERLRDLDDVSVVDCDGLSAFGRPLRHAMRDGYRWQLRWAPWSYSVLYWLMTQVAPARVLGARILALSGQRALLRLIAEHHPDVVVSTHPAITCVLGRLRLHRRLATPVVATITDLADYAFWSHPGADLHLVMHPRSIGPVERVAGLGSAAHVRPLVGKAFVQPVDREQARRALDLPVDLRVIAVSGGGWGVGDLASAVSAARRLPESYVVALTGRNTVAHQTLTRRFEGDPHVRVLGFTDRMHEVLQAADVLVHSTGGVTSLEALSCGCPLVAYGADLGHIRVHNRALANLGLIELADNPAELAAVLEASLDVDRRGMADMMAGPCAAETVIAVNGRVAPLPRWRIAAGHAMTMCAAVLLTVGGATTDDAYSLIARPLDARPISHLASDDRVALIVRAPGAAVPAVADELARHGANASFASVTAPSPTAQAAIARAGGDVLPELGSGGRIGWLGTAESVETSRRIGADRRYLAPARGLTLAQYVLARTEDASPIVGRLAVDVDRPVGGVQAQPGDVVVVEVATLTPAVRKRIAAIVEQLSAQGLRGSSLSQVDVGRAIPR